MKKIISAALVLAFSLSAFTPALAASLQAESSAGILYKNDIFAGKGIDENGDPVFDLDSKATRQEATTLLVTLMGKAEEAKATPVDIPFKDVSDWAKPFVSYAYNNGIVAGMGENIFGADEEINKNQFITMVLCALGYEANTDFLWNQSQYLARDIRLIDEIKVEQFSRENIVLLSHRALYTKIKGSDKTLAESLGIVLDDDSYETSDELMAVIKARYGFDIEFEKPVTDEATKFFILDTFYKYCSQTVPDPLMKDLALYRKTLMFTIGGKASLGSSILKIPVSTYKMKYSTEQKKTALSIAESVPDLIGEFFVTKYWRDIPENIKDDEFEKILSELVLMYDVEYKDGSLNIGTNHSHRAMDGYYTGASSKDIIKVKQKLEQVYEILCNTYELDAEEKHLIDPYGYRKYR
ncbi:MAG: S-layer homology domain-containing protein [Lachnospiraceae bacterium]|nr:S-layer homology domain-containing protein [Lachnospiraceae bacterium]